MAASVYATPPPDLSSEDTALSDVSNSSQISSSSSNSKAIKRNLSATLLGNQGTSNSYDSMQIDQLKKRRKQSTPIRISALNLSTTTVVGSTTPTETTSTTQAITTATTTTTSSSSSSSSTLATTLSSSTSDVVETPSLDKNDNNEQKFLQKIFLPGLSQIEKAASPATGTLSLANPITELQDNISNVEGFHESKVNLEAPQPQSQPDKTQQDNESKSPNGDGEMDGSPMRRECDQCGEKFDTDIKLGVHILRHHAEQARSKRLMEGGEDDDEEEGEEEEDDDDENKMGLEMMPLKIKMEPDTNETNSNDERLSALSGLGRPDDWLSAMPGLNFPFPPEAAAAALSASNYLSQLPLLSVPPVGPFPSVEGLSRPPLRIFNPEAYCDLCNKEFCNKYFLKTHKANKHGIYDPAGSANDIPTSNQMSQITQVLQMQFQQQQQLQLPHAQLQQQQQQIQQQMQQQQQLQQQQAQQGTQQQQQQPSQQQLPSQQQQQQPQHHISNSPQPLMPPEPAIYCDICHKRFMNVFAMKRHRNKVHEIPPPTSPQVKTELDLGGGGGGGGGGQNEKECSTPGFLRMPEGFREDYTVEQEDVSFTPQPRKLSPFSSQQAREANFSAEKLKRLGVVNPEAFCDLCCKEYCNKYFLRTHKLKRHGILIPPDDVKDEKFPWHFVQTTPLNLMMGVEKIRRKSSDSEDVGKISVKTQQQLEEIRPSNGGDQEDVRLKDVPSSMDISEKAKSILEGTTSSQDADAISVDLQKLQSMILQLNDLNGHRPMNCNICGKEFENQYILHAHIVSDHSGTVGLGGSGSGNLLSGLPGAISGNSSDSNNGGIKTSRNSSPSISASSQNEVCKQCDKEFSTIFEMKQHIFEVHGMQSGSPLRDGFVTPERPIKLDTHLPTTPNQNERRPPYTITPTSSYCEICNKELCNKYFMKTHMQRMHGIEIENGAQIGGVVCNICNKELCSKYFLRVHKHNTHGIVEEGSPLPQSRQNGEQPEPENLFPMDNVKPDLADLSNRYFSHYTQVCPLCSRRFRSSKWLREHLMNDHGKAGNDKLREIEQQLNFTKSSSPTLKIPNGGVSSSTSSSNTNPNNNPGPPTLPGPPLALNNMDPSFLAKGAFPNFFMGDDTVSSSSRLKEYQCSFCSFSTPYYAFLFIHERSSHTFGNQIKSEAAVSIAKDHNRFTQPSTTMVTTCSTPTTTTPASTPVPQTPQENANSTKRHDHTGGNHLLNDVANLANRPASYAVPQNSSNEIMQSFLIEEANNGNRTSPMDDNESTNNLQSNRFVPAVVFLPVRERISGPITVSFTLTPA